MAAADRLAFERQWFRTAAGKVAAIRARFGQSPVAYYQALNRPLDDPPPIGRIRLLGEAAAVGPQVRQAGGLGVPAAPARLARHARGSPVL